MQESRLHRLEPLNWQDGGGVDQPGCVGQAADPGRGGAGDGPGHCYPHVCPLSLLLPLPVLSIPGQDPTWLVA